MPSLAYASASPSPAAEAGASPLPRLSIVVPTFNRAATLRESLWHLAAQSLPACEFELIVVDDGSADSTRAVVEEARARCGFTIEYLYHPNRGPGHTQNRGIRAARAPVVLLMADDILMTPAALAAHLAAHEREPSPALAVLGCVLQSPELDQSVFLAKWDPFRMSGLREAQELPYYMFWACNVSFRREFMLRYGMFRDEMGRFGPAAHEDVELGYRLHAHGLRIVFARAALGHHYHVDTVEATMRRFYQRGQNWIDLHDRVPEVEIDIHYRVYNLATLFAKRRELTRTRRRYLLRNDSGLARLTLIYVVRRLMFNRLTVKPLWLRLFAGAERRRWLAALMHENMYRGVFMHCFLQGCRGASRQR